MKKIEITEENYEAYKELMTIIEDGCYEKYDSLLGILVFTTLIAGIAIGLSSFIYGIANNMVLTANNYLITCVAILITTATGTYLQCKIPTSLSIKDFKKKYPNFVVNVDINIEELEKELVKYEELSVIPKDIEMQKEEHLSIDNDDVKEMSTEEKLAFLEEEIAFLEEEKEFWEQVQTYEKYSVSNDNKKETQKTKILDFNTYRK